MTAPRDVYGKRLPAGRFCRGRRPRRPAEVYGKQLPARRLRAGHARPLQDNNKNRDTGPCGSVSLLLMRFYAFLKPTLCMNLTKAA